MMLTESAILKVYRHIDVIIVTSLCLVLYINLPDFLFEVCRVPYDFAILITVITILIPIVIIWLLLMIYTTKNIFYKNIEETIKRLQRISVSFKEIRKLDNFHLRAHLIPFAAIQTLFAALLFMSNYSEPLMKNIVILVGIIVLPLLVPLMSRVFSKAKEERALKDSLCTKFNIKVNFVGIIECSIINAYAVSVPIYKIVYFTAEALKLNQEELDCLLAHEVYHLIHNNTYLSSITSLVVLSLTYTAVSELLRLNVINPREGFSLALLAFYSSVKLLSRFLTREFEKRADLFAARLVGHARYIEFLSKLLSEDRVITLFVDPYLSIKERIKAIRNDAERVKHYQPLRSNASSRGGDLNPGKVGLQPTP